MSKEQRIARIVVHLVARDFVTYRTSERAKLIRIRLQGVKSKRPNLNHQLIFRETVVVFRNRERLLTQQINQKAADILGGCLDVNKIIGLRFKEVR